MNRILFEPSEVNDLSVAEFGGVRAQHVRDVLHGSPGMTLKTGVVDGPVGTSEIVSISDAGAVTVRCRHETPSPRPWIDLVLAPPRPRALKRLLPQLATLGVGRIVLVGAEKVEKAFWGAQLLKPEVNRPLLVEGLQQAGTSILPEIRMERNFRRWAAGGGLEEAFAGQGVRFVAHPYAASSAPPRFGAGAFAETAASVPAARPVLAVGPEGGWTEDEVALLESRGFVRHSLGRRILRTDTALIALIAQLMPRFDEAARPCGDVRPCGESRFQETEEEKGNAS